MSFMTYLFMPLLTAFVIKKCRRVYGVTRKNMPPFPRSGSVKLLLNAEAGKRKKPWCLEAVTFYASSPSRTAINPETATAPCHHQGFGGQVAKCAGRNNVAVNPALPCAANRKEPPLLIIFLSMNMESCILICITNCIPNFFKKKR